MNGVITPLKIESSVLELTQEINTRTEDKYGKNLIENTVKKTLKQIGAKIERWDEI